MPDKHYIVVVPGTEKGQAVDTYLVHQWEKSGFIPYIIAAAWRKNEVFSQKLQRVLEVIDACAPFGAVSLVGISDGASIVMNAFAQRKEKVSAVINVCGRVKAGDKVFPSLDMASHGNSVVRESVLFCSVIEHLLNKSDKEKVLTLRAFFDEVVPASTCTISGAHNTCLPVVEHNAAILFALSLYKKKIFNFLAEHRQKVESKIH